MNFFIYVGIIFILVSGLCIRSWTTDYQQRGNFNSKPTEDLDMMKKIATWSTLAGIISFAVAGLIYLLG